MWTELKVARGEYLNEMAPLKNVKMYNACSARITREENMGMNENLPLLHTAADTFHVSC